MVQEALVGAAAELEFQVAQFFHIGAVDEQVGEVQEAGRPGVGGGAAVEFFKGVAREGDHGFAQGVGAGGHGAEGVGLAEGFAAGEGDAGQ